MKTQDRTQDPLTIDEIALEFLREHEGTVRMTMNRARSERKTMGETKAALRNIFLDADHDEFWSVFEGLPQDEVDELLASEEKSFVAQALNI